MKSLILFAALVGYVFCNTSHWTHIRVKFAFSGYMENVDAFWIIRNTQKDAEADKWVKVECPNSLGLTTLCLSQEDVRVCALYDVQGSIAGIQCAIPPTDVEGKGIPYDFNKFGVFEKKFINWVEYWTSTFLIVSPETIEDGGRDVVETLGDGLWFKNRTSFTEVPTDEAIIASETPYTKQNCLPNMGTHYYYDMYKTSCCKNFQPFFLMTKDGSMDGIGWQFFGKTKYVKRNWYDNINRQAVELTVPNGPKCLGDWTDMYGVISVHFYFVDNPWEIKCDQEKESAVPITNFWGRFILTSLYTIGNIGSFFKSFLSGRYIF